MANHNWNQLKQRLEMGARPNKYLVEIEYPAGISGVDKADGETIATLCKGTSVPSREMGVAEVYIQGRKIPIPGDAQYSGTWDLTFYNTPKHDLRKSFEQWIEAMDSYRNHKRDISHTSYTGTLFVRQLDTINQNEINASWRFEHCFPTAISNVNSLT